MKLFVYVLGLLFFIMHGGVMADDVKMATLSILDVFPELGSQAQKNKFTFDYIESLDGVMQNAELNQVSLDNGVLSAAGKGFRVDFTVQSRGSYLVLRIKDVVEPAPGMLMRLEFSAPDDSPLVLTCLDYVTLPARNGKTMAWPWIWARNASNPWGAFAIQAPRNDEEFDENLLQMWVHDGLPHPPGEWNIDRARSWLANWQSRFSDQSCLVIGAKNREELDSMTVWAEKIGMKRVYLHTDTWRGEYWPMHNSYLNVNREVFPNGEQDLNNYTAGLRTKGMSVALHSTCMSIGRFDPDYVKNGIDPRLSRWARGTLAQDVGGADTTLYFRPEPGFRFPRQQRDWAGPGTIARWMDQKLFLLGDELVEARSLTKTDEDVWVLEGCRRGAWGKLAASHKAGAVFEGMTRPYGQAFVPNPDSTLFQETIRRWAEFCSRNNVDHLECDALEDHQDLPWGARKFSWILSSLLSLPSTSNTSGGTPLPFHIEYWFRSSREAANNHALAGVAGGASLPLYLHNDIRTATGPYEILFKPAEMVGRGGSSFNISYPWPMFGVTPEIVSKHGMVPVVTSLINDWRTVLTDINSDCRQKIRQVYSQYSRPNGSSGSQQSTDILFRPEVVDGKKSVVPLRLVGRDAGELSWGYGQEFGPIVPRQYLRAGESLKLNNAYKSQEPEFVVRVLGDMVEPTVELSDSKERTGANGAILDAYAAGTTTEHAVHPLHTAQHIWPTVALRNGEAMAGDVMLRREFVVHNPDAIKRARLYVQVDDEGEVYMNGKRIFSGGQYDEVLFVEVTNFRKGKNILSARVGNQGGPGVLTAALHMELDDAARVLVSDSDWQGKVVGGDWGAVTEIAAFGESVWPRVEPELALSRSNLMPGDSIIKPAEGQDLVVEDDIMRVECSNDNSTEAFHLYDRPSWATSLDMSNARGIGCTVIGDGSGAVLVISIEGDRQRDYVVPLDFIGEREIEIPSGEVAWGHPRWSWHDHASRFSYRNIRKVRVGFGSVPAKTHAKAIVTNLRPLQKVSCELQDLAIKLGSGSELVVQGIIPRDHYLWYRGGDNVGLYDLNWNRVGEMPLRKQNFVFPAGSFSVELKGIDSKRNPWLELQFFTKGDPIQM